MLLGRYCHQVAYLVQYFISDSSGVKHETLCGLFANNLPSKEVSSELTAVNEWLVF